MRKVILYIATSLDGYIAGPNGEIDWLFTEGEYGYDSFLSSIDTTVMGRKTYELTKTFGEWPYPDHISYVFSLEKSDPGDKNVRWVRGDAAEFIRTLKDQPGKHIWCVGGGEVNTALLKAGLIDEMRIFVHPIILGQGLPLFAGNPPQTSLRFTGSRDYDTGLIELRYAKS